MQTVANGIITPLQFGIILAVGLVLAIVFAVYMADGFEGQVEGKGYTTKYLNPAGENKDGGKGQDSADVADGSLDGSAVSEAKKEK
jgi:hypothetical protein